MPRNGWFIFTQISEVEEWYLAAARAAMKCAAHANYLATERCEELARYVLDFDEFDPDIFE